MKLLLLLLVASSLMVALASAGRSPKNNPAWMVWPGDNGKPQLAILRGPKSEAKFDPAEVTFHLFTKSNMDYSIQMYVGDMNRAPFDPTKETKFIVHGYTSSGFTSWVIEMKYKFLVAGDYNVISVDWESPASGPFYDNAKFRADPTGTYLGEFMSYLATQGADLGKFHCTGHSLGAHVCGFAGEAVGGALGRVTGMDPALPLYDYQNLGERLDESDAKFVDVIHTCGGWLGFFHPLGHADFYPNDGTEQPGCSFDLTGACSHDRSHEYFTESIQSTGFRSLRCDTWKDFNSGACAGNQELAMGEQVPANAFGTYYLLTSGRPPFALG